MQAGRRVAEAKALKTQCLHLISDHPTLCVQQYKGRKVPGGTGASGPAADNEGSHRFLRLLSHAILDVVVDDEV